MAGQRTPAEIASARMAARAELQPLCARAQETDRAEDEVLESRHSAAVEIALLSEEGFWRFITSPSTSHLDRMSAAREGGASITPKELPRFWSAVAELEHAPTGVSPSPCDYLMSANLSPDQWAERKERRIEARSVTGQKLESPPVPVDFPVTLEQRNGSSLL
jgi:hypothetical protein